MGTNITSLKKSSLPKTSSYSAALILFGSLLPLPSVATIITAAIYITPLQALIQSFNSPWLISSWVVIIAGIIITLLFWLLVSLFFRNFTAMENANPVSGSHLRNHFCTLRAGFEALTALPGYEANLPPERQYSYRIAKAQVASYLEKITECIQSKGAYWVAGTGYLTAWNLIHRAEEAMIALEPREEVIREAIYDEFCLTGSQIDSAPNLLDKLKLAIKKLSPSATIYLDQAETQNTTSNTANAANQKMHPPAQMPTQSSNQQENLSTKKEADSPAQEPSMVTSPDPTVSTQSGASKVIVQPESDNSDAKPSSPTIPASNGVITSAIAAVEPLTEIEARNALRDVRRTINEYRDHLWEGLVTERNQLMGTAIITGLMTYVLLGFTIIAGASPTSITAAIAFYLVGALTGLFSQLYSESQLDRASDDYNLTLARIIVTPVLSGLTAIGGVLLTTLVSLSLIRSSGQTNPLGLQDGFSLQSNPLGVLIAAAFSLTPKLFIGALMQKSQDFINQLQTTGASDQATTTTTQS